jgi:hypothetical protein
VYNSEEALFALQKILNRFMTPNLLTLHPSLMQFEIENKIECPTCYKENVFQLKNNNNMKMLLLDKNSETRLNVPRGLITNDESKVFLFFIFFLCLNFILHPKFYFLL